MDDPKLLNNGSRECSLADYKCHDLNSIYFMLSLSRHDGQYFGPIVISSLTALVLPLRDAVRRQYD